MSWKQSLDLITSIGPMSAASECLICQDRANAHSHYGAISCTSCRAFFRRAVISKADYQCIFGTEKCQITKTTRKRCQSCRLRACLRVGMKPGWVSDEKGRPTSPSRQSPASPLEINTPPANLTHVTVHAGVNGVKRLRDHLELSSDSIGLTAMSSVTGDTNLAVYSDLVSRAVKLARSFAEFSTLAETDQKVLLLHNVDPMVQICCCGKYSPPWWRGTDLVAVQHRDLRNEMQMLHPDWRVTLMLAFVALFSTRYCADSLNEKPLVDEARESGREMLKHFLISSYGQASGMELFSKWSRILHCLQLQTEGAMAQKLTLLPEKRSH